ncbi:hypothetical protein J7T55_015767 [Diaporthe amygdali]|uniref:uncharacterized protein n=1 Tax=Phomopsis amygdali TaxID=1214568 RepID=UPI0022FDFC38|nr:uncharacterized protein J7T55_015767 [Diaporthe amygdali]KAJ0107302.1 hypothetical protein J7T55_015767 [Diaporthe amygdali]
MATVTGKAPRQKIGTSGAATGAKARIRSLMGGFAKGLTHPVAHAPSSTLPAALDDETGCSLCHPGEWERLTKATNEDEQEEDQRFETPGQTRSSPGALFDPRCKDATSDPHIHDDNSRPEIRDWHGQPWAKHRLRHLDGYRVQTSD